MKEIVLGHPTKILIIVMIAVINLQNLTCQQTPVNKESQTKLIPIAFNEKAIITGDQLRMRLEPTLNGKVITKLSLNDEVVVLEKVKGDELRGSSDWYKIRNGKNEEGFVFASYVKIIPGGAATLNRNTESESKEINQIGLTTGSSVRVRKEANTSAAVIAQLYEGNFVTVLSAVKGETLKGTEEWYHVYLINDYGEDIEGQHDGYVHSSLIQIGDGLNEVYNKLSVEKKVVALFKNSALIDSLRQFTIDFQNLNNDRDTEKLFHTAQALSHRASNEGLGYQIYDYDSDLTWFSKAFPGFQLEMDYDYLSLHYSLSAFSEKVKDTNGKDDDDFFDFLINSSHQSCISSGDCCDGISYVNLVLLSRSIEAIDELIQRLSLFKDELTDEREQLLNYLSLGRYQQPKEEVEAVLREFMINYPLDEKQNADISEVLKLMEKENDDKLQFNCPDQYSLC